MTLMEVLNELEIRIHKNKQLLISSHLSSPWPKRARKELEFLNSIKIHLGEFDDNEPTKIRSC